jgi:hypothetical protein
MRNLMSKKLLAIVLTLATNIVLMIFQIDGGDPEVQQSIAQAHENLMIALNSLVGVYVTGQAVVDKNK